MPGWLIILIAVLVVLGVLFLWPKVFNIDYKGGDGGKHYATQSVLLK